MVWEMVGAWEAGSKRKDLRKCKWGRSCQIILEFLKESSVLLSKGAQGPSSFLGLPIQWIPKGWNQQLLHRSSSSILLEQMAFFLLVPFFSWMDGGKRDKSNQEHLLLSLLWFIKKEVWKASPKLGFSLLFGTSQQSEENFLFDQRGPKLVVVLAAHWT